MKRVSRINIIKHDYKLSKSVSLSPSNVFLLQSPWRFRAVFPDRLIGPRVRIEKPR